MYTEIIAAVEKITGRKVHYKISERRMGDPAKVVASSEKVNEILKWKSEFTNIEEIIESSWEWLNKN